MSFDNHHELQLMEAVAAQPDTSQAALADQLDIAVGTVNWYLKKWSKKGYVKVSRVSRWRWHYLLTPQGLAEKSRLTRRYLEASMRLFRDIRDESRRLLTQVREAGYETLVVDGDGELAEIVTLSCLEMGLERANTSRTDLPRLQIRDLDLALVWPEDEAMP